jgi:hypothetical protein
MAIPQRLARAQHCLMERKGQNRSAATEPKACPGCLLCKGTGSWYVDAKRAEGVRGPRRSASLTPNQSVPRLWVT